MKSPTGTIIMTCLIVAICFCGMLFYTFSSFSNISGGNEVLDTSCTESNELIILVGKFNGERTWVSTNVKCEGKN